MRPAPHPPHPRRHPPHAMRGKKGSGHGGCQQTHPPTEHPAASPVSLPTCSTSDQRCSVWVCWGQPYRRSHTLGGTRPASSLPWPAVPATPPPWQARAPCPSCRRLPSPRCLHPASCCLWLPAVRSSFGAKAPGCPHGPPFHRGRRPVPLLPSQGPSTPSCPAEVGGPISLPAQEPQHRCPSPGVPVLVPTGPSPPAARLSWRPALPTPVVQPVVQWLVPLPPHPQFPTCDHVPLLPGSQCDLAPLPRVAPGSPSWATETSPSSEGLSLATCGFLEGVLFPWGRARLDKVGDLGVGRRVTGHPQERRDCHSGGTVCTGQLQVPCPAPRQTAAWWPPLEKPLPGSDHSLLPGHRADGSWVLIPGRETTSPAFWAAGHSQGIRFGQVGMSSVCCWRRSRGGSSQDVAEAEVQPSLLQTQ